MKSLEKKQKTQRAVFSDIALLVQRNEDLREECMIENERLKQKVNRLINMIKTLKKKCSNENQR